MFLFPEQDKILKILHEDYYPIISESWSCYCNWHEHESPFNILIAFILRLRNEKHKLCHSSLHLYCILSGNLFLHLLNFPHSKVSIIINDVPTCTVKWNRLSMIEHSFIHSFSQPLDPHKGWVKNKVHLKWFQNNITDWLKKPKRFSYVLRS